MEKAERITLLCRHFSKVFPMVEQDDIVYCDPPYVPLSTTASFSSYAQDGFSAQEQKQLAELVAEYEGKAKIILVSNHDTDFTQAIYRDSVIKTIDVQRNIAAKSGSRKKVNELLVIYA